MEIGMQVMKVRQVLIGAVVAFASMAAVESSYGQTPGAPQVTVLPDNSVIVSYAAPVTPPSGTLLVATHNGVPIGPFAIGTATTVSSGGSLPAGTYTVQIVWGSGNASPVSTFVVGPGGAPILPPAGTTMHPAVLVGNTVTVQWDPIADVSSYELEAILFESGQRFSLSVGGTQTSLVVPGVSFGNYTVRVRGRNAFGPGPWSNQILVSIGSSIRLRDMEVTLTWNTLADLDLHIIEPSGTHVSWARRRGVTSRLDVDNTAGFGPETAIVDVLGAAPGVYQVFIVHYRGAFPTTATVSITLNVGSANAQTMIFTRQSNANDSTRGLNVALVDVKSGVIGETFGTRSLPAQDPRVVKPQ
jgi:hypothetical protein